MPNLVGRISQWRRCSRSIRSQGAGGFTILSITAPALGSADGGGRSFHEFAADASFSRRRTTGRDLDNRLVSAQKCHCRLRAAIEPHDVIDRVSDRAFLTREAIDQAGEARLIPHLILDTTRGVVSFIRVGSLPHFPDALSHASAYWESRKRSYCRIHNSSRAIPLLRMAERYTDYSSSQLHRFFLSHTSSSRPAAANFDAVYKQAH